MIRLLFGLISVVAAANSSADSAIVPLVRNAAANIRHVSIFNRTPVSDQLDLVLAFGRSYQSTDAMTNGQWWPMSGPLGIFLQERENPNKVYRLAIESGTSDCFAHLERVTATDTVISCTPEKGSFGPLHKFIYDIRAKTLLHHIEYLPFGISRAFPSSDRIVFTARDQPHAVAFDYQEERTPAFRLLDGMAANLWTYRATQPPPLASFGPGNRFTLKREGEGEDSILIVSESAKPKPILHYLPQATYDEFAKVRPEAYANGLRRESTKIIEKLGPWQLEGNRLWVGKSFYDGEGYTGVGSFGYFDSSKRSYQLYSPPEIRRSSISAMLVEPDAIWLGLVHHGEYGSSGTGVVRFDRKSETVEKFDVPNIVSSISRLGKRLFLTNDLGVTVIEDGKIQRYFVDQLSDGRLRIAEAR